ncbi:MAG TPA: hypothetical protein VE959_31885 [Bryobacteraceae bacterium]|nr:hypothetical protein [Bryobacteraceae bacterium]
MAARKTVEEADLRSYFQGRVEPLAKRLLDIAEALFSTESIQQHQEFDERVQRGLQNGAKFVPRKRHPR